MNVIDIRPDRLLREIRDHGDLTIAIEKAGMAIDELDGLLKSHPKFQLAVIECLREYHEDQVLAAHAETRKTIVDSHDSLLVTLDESKDAAIKEIQNRFALKYAAVL